MTSVTSTPSTMSAVPAFQEHHGLLRFTVDIGERQISAFLSDGVWRARYAQNSGGASLAERYRSNRATIDAAVKRRVQSGARVPVVLRSDDL